VDPRLQRIVKQAQSGPAMNPGGDDQQDAGTMLQLGLLRSGLKNEFSEDDMFEAAKAVGVPEDDIPSWLEDFASYL